MPIAAVLSLTSIAWRVSDPNDLIVRMGPPGGPNGSLPAWQDNRSYLHRRSVPLPSRSATRSAHRTTHPATPRPRPGRLHVLSLIRMVTGIRTLGICCVEHRARGVAEDALASFRPRLPE